MKHEKCIFVPQGEYSRMHIENDLISKQENWVVQIIIADERKKVKLHWQWNTVNIKALGKIEVSYTKSQ